jgi:hypothetical protein
MVGARRGCILRRVTISSDRELLTETTQNFQTSGYNDVEDVLGSEYDLYS